jgi:hypothetical protein
MNQKNDDMNRKENDVLQTIFDRMAEKEETLPEGFREEMMNRIRSESVRMQQHSERMQLLLLLATSLAIVGLAVATFLYLDITLPRITFPTISISAPYLLPGALTLLLLMADCLLRQAYDKKHPY